MSASSIDRAANDPQLRARIDALTQKEVIYNEDLAASDFGTKVLSGMAMMTSLYWAVAVATEAAYETALLAQRGAPGYDTDIITDGDITSAINAHWPPDPPEPPAVVPAVQQPVAQNNHDEQDEPTPEPPPVEQVD